VVARHTSSSISAFEYVGALLRRSRPKTTVHRKMRA
jgi:hypothetical protein